jgi:abequosyltransferase
VTITLSLVISTLNRADFIGDTLDSIIPQIGEDCELIVFDGASKDNTSQIVSAAASRCARLRYIRAEHNSGVDRDYDLAVSEARGRYCWLLSDDDLLKAGAVVRVIDLLKTDPDLVVVDAEVRDVSLQRIIVPQRLRFSGERRYTESDQSLLLRDAGDALSFIGGTIIRRDLWMSRDRERFYGSFFVHMGVIFQAPLRAIVVAEPLIILRLGNAGWTARAFEIWMFRYPDLIWGFVASKAAKQAVTPRYPWRHMRHILSFRAKGAYTVKEYSKHFSDVEPLSLRFLLLIVSVLPGRLTNCAALIGHVLLGQRKGNSAYTTANNNRFSNIIGRWIVS